MEKVGAVSKDKWVSDVIGKLDRKYYTRADGQLMNDAELSAFLGEAYNTIATGGLNKLTDTGMRISGARANRGNASRQIHFKDADSYLQYQQLYGDRSLWEIMVGHLEGISKDIALVETYGPNPDHVFRSFLIRLRQKRQQLTRVKPVKSSGWRTTQRICTTLFPERHSL